jgi:hypothetical protein
MVTILFAVICNRARIDPEIRDFIRRMSTANPLWGAPRIHGELLKLGINISQATVGRWMPWRSPPRPGGAFCATTFQTLQRLTCSWSPRRRSSCSTPDRDGGGLFTLRSPQNPTQDWLAGQVTEAFPWDTAPGYLLRDRDKSYGPAAGNIIALVLAPAFNRAKLDFEQGQC